MIAAWGKMYLSIISPFMLSGFMLVGCSERNQSDAKNVRRKLMTGTCDAEKQRINEYLTKRNFAKDKIGIVSVRYSNAMWEMLLYFKPDPTKCIWNALSLIQHQEYLSSTNRRIIYPMFDFDAIPEDGKWTWKQVDKFLFSWKKQVLSQAKQQQSRNIQIHPSKTKGNIEEPNPKQ